MKSGSMVKDTGLLDLLVTKTNIKTEQLDVYFKTGASLLTNII